MVKLPGHWISAAAFGEGRHPQHQQPLAKGDGQNVAGGNIVARFDDLDAVQANMARFDQTLREASGLHDPGVPQPFVEALAGQVTFPSVWP